MTKLTAALLVVLLLATCASQPVVAQGDLYAALGLERGADEDAVKKAFKKLARKLHPDAQTDEDAKKAAREKFLKISEAYETLVNPEKKRQYDQGMRPGTAGDNRQYLRHALFDDFVGAQFNGDEVHDMINGKRAEPTVVFFWSSNYLDCIDAGLVFKNFAAKMQGTSVNIGVLKCDDHITPCRQLQLGDLPKAVLFLPRGSAAKSYDFFTGKYTMDALLHFVSPYFKQARKLIDSCAVVLQETCPNPARSVGHWASAYFFDTSKRCYAGDFITDFIALEYSPCYDCRTELMVLLESVKQSLPDFTARRFNCKHPANRDFCQQLKSRNRAWTIVKTRRRCWYAMKRPFVFSDEHCEALQRDDFGGKYHATEFLNFIVKNKPTHQKRLTSIPAIKKSNDAFAVLFVDGRRGEKPTSSVQWELVARVFNTFHPPTSRKGFKLHAAYIDCAVVNSCSDAPPQALQRPTVALYGYGPNVKKLPPIILDPNQNAASLVARILKEAEPLHLHILTPQNYDKKVNGGLMKNRRWFIVFNAGQWCPPCMQIKPEWEKATRIIQESEAAKKLSVGAVDCDKHKNLCKNLNIQNYPTMAFIAKGRPRVEFGGNRNAQSLAEWAADQVDNRLQKFGFQELQMLQREGKKVLVSFTAGQWCPPCNQLGPIMKKVANKLPDMLVSQLNCDENQRACQNYNIDGFPTVVLFVSGRMERFDGDRRVDSIAAWAKQTK